MIRLEVERAGAEWAHRVELKEMVTQGRKCVGW
jgi:hypothetical protein